MFDWIGVIGVIGGVGGAISIWHAVKFRKQESIKADSEAHRSKAEAYQQDITASDSAMNTIKELNSMVEGLMKDRIDQNKKINELSDEIEESSRIIRTEAKKSEELRRVFVHKFKLVQEILGEQIELKQHAESHFCSVVECTLREPPLSSYRTSNATDRMKELYEDLKRGKIDIDGFDEVEEELGIKKRQEE